MALATNGAANGNGNATNARLALLSDALDRLAFAQLHGLQYEDARDLYKLGGYPRTLTFNHYASLYQRDPVAGAIVDMPAETTWRLPPEISEPDRPDGTSFTEAWTELAERLQVWRRFEAVDKLARIGRYAVLLIGTKGADNALASPLPRMRGPDAVLYLAPYAEAHAKPDTWVTDTGDPRYGQPESYAIDLAGSVEGFRRTGGGTQIVHASRVLHIAEGALTDPVYGRPALERIYNDLADYAKISTSTAEAFWQRVAGILVAQLKSTVGATEVEWDDGDLASLDETLKELYHDLRRTAYIQDGELKRLAETEPDPGPASKLYERRISAGSGIPARMIFGSETGERSSTEDQKSWLGQIGERQTTHGEPVFVRAFIERLILAGALPRPSADGYDVVWPTLFKESELEVASANRARAETAKALTALGGDPLALVEVDEDRNVWLIPRDASEPSPFEMLEPEPPLDPDQPVDEDGDEGDEPDDARDA
jgi:hypothetical protein